MNVPYRPGDLWNATTLNGLRHEELLEFAKRERINPIQSNEDIIRQLLIRPPKEIPERWMRILMRISSEIETTRAMAVEPVEDRVSADGSRREDKRPRTFPRPEYIEEVDLPQRVVYKETENGFVANIVGARAGSSLMPAFKADINNEPTNAASAAITGHVAPTLEEVPHNPARRVFGVLYEAKELTMQANAEGNEPSGAHSQQPSLEPTSGPSREAGAPSPATVDIERRLRPAPQGHPSDSFNGPTPDVDTVGMRGATLIMKTLEGNGAFEPHALVPAHLDVPFVQQWLYRAEPIIFVHGDGSDGEQIIESVQPITPELWESAPPSSLEGVEQWMVEEWMVEVENEVFKPKIRLEPEPEPVAKPIAPQPSTSMACGSKRETIMGLMQMEVDDEDTEASGEGAGSMQGTSALVPMGESSSIASTSGTKRKHDNEGGRSEKRSRANPSEIWLALEEAGDKSERSVGVLARKMARACCQRRQVEDAKQELQVLLDRKKELAKTLKEKVEVLKARKTFVEDVCLSAAMNRSMHVNVPAEEGPVAGSSRHANAYVEEKKVQDLTEFNLPPLVLKLNKPTDGASKFKPNGRNAEVDFPLPKFRLA